MDSELSALAPAAAAGDASALERIVRGTQVDVWRLCAYLVDRQSADDLTQETYLRAQRSLVTYRGEAPLRSWLLTIARRVCGAELEARARRRDLALKVRPLTARHAPDSGDVDLGLLIAALEPQRRAAFVLTQVIGCDYAEAALICDCPIGTVRSRVARARADLVAALSDASRATAANPGS